MSNKAASNVIPMRESDRPSADPHAAQFERLLKECQKLAMDRLSQAVAVMLDKAEEALRTLADRTTDREQRDVYLRAKDRVIAERKTIEHQFRQNYLGEFERRAQREAKRDQFSQYDLSSLELGLVNDEDLEETLKINDMAAKLRRYCEEELNGLDQRVGVLIGDANLQADGNPFSPQAIGAAWKLTCRGLEPAMKIRMIFHKLFDDHVLDEVRSIYKDLNALLIQRSILPKIRFGARRGAGAAGRRPLMGPAQGIGDAAQPGAGTMPAGLQPLSGMGTAMPMASGAAGDGGYGADAAGAEQDFFSVLQSLVARSTYSRAMPGAPGAGSAHGTPGGQAVPGATMMGAGAPMPGASVGVPAGTVQIPGFPPILTDAVEGGAAGLPAPGAMPATPGSMPTGLGIRGASLPQRFLQGAELIGSLTRLQHGDVAVLPAGMPAIDLHALASGRTNVVRELKSSALGNQVDQTDGVTIDIVAMLFDQIFGDQRVPEALKALIGRLQIPVVKVAVLDKKFFSKKSHPARRMLDTLGEFALGLDENFDQSSPLYKKIEAIIARLLDEFVDNVATFETLQGELLAVIREENRRAEISAKEMARKIAYKERLEVGKAMAQLEIKKRVQTTQMPPLVQKFLADEWMKLLLLTCARHGQDSDAWKSALETMDHLIWSVTFKPSIEDRRKLAHLLPGLLKRVQIGLSLTTSAEEKRKHFFSKLMRLHTKAMSGPVSKPTAAAGAVPTVSEQVIAAPAAQQAREPATNSTAGNLPVSAEPVPAVTPAFDFGLEPIALAVESAQPTAPQPAEDVVVPPAMPVMTSSTPVAADTSAPALDADEDTEAPAAPLEFSNVTIKSPFGDGDIQVEEIDLSDLPGFGAGASSDAGASVVDQYSQAVKKLKAGDWLEFREGDTAGMQARLSYISPLKGTYLFVNRRGEKVAEYSLMQLAEELRSSRAVVLEDVPLIERAMSSLVGALKKNVR